MALVATSVPEDGDIDVSGVKVVTMSSLADHTAMFVVAEDGAIVQICVKDAAMVARLEAGETFSLHAMSLKTWQVLDNLGEHKLPATASLRRTS